MTNQSIPSSPQSAPKTALITGGSRGLGRSMALHLAGLGVDTVITYHSAVAQAESVVLEIEALGARGKALQLDTGQTGGFEEFATALDTVLEAWAAPGLDYLINNAGIGIHESIAEATEEAFDQLMNVHFKGVFFLTQHLLPRLRDGGRILNLSTGLTRFTFPGYAAYASMKGAVEVFTRYLAHELGPRQITVNTVAPGAIATDFGGGVVRDNAEVRGYIAQNTALGRVGEADDIGGAVASLLTGENGWMTGQRIEVSGGQSL